MKTLADMRPVYVAGIGLHPYQNRSQTSYVTLGLRAVRESLEDAGIEKHESGTPARRKPEIMERRDDTAALGGKRP